MDDFVTIAESFASWGGRLELGDVPEEIQRVALLHLLDGLGNALAARRLGIANYAIKVGRSFAGPPEASIIGEHPSVGSMAAAFANGILMHGLDFDDTHASALVHATAVTLPTALAVGEEFHVSGTQFLEASIAGYELVTRLGSAAPHGFHERGFHATSVCGVFSSALIAGRLMGLPESDVVNALGIAGSQSSGSMEFLATGASTKQIHPGWASMGGIVAARLAREGATGPATIFEGNYGLYSLFSDVDPDLSSITTDLGSLWQTGKSSIKPYPACYLLRPTLDAVLTLAGRLPVDSIDEVILGIPHESFPVVCEPEDEKMHPKNSYDAKFSAQWTAAIMLIDGKVDIDTFGQHQLARPDVLKLAERVHIRSVPVTGAVADTPADVRVIMSDGTIFHATDSPTRNVMSGMSEDAIVSKFVANVGGSGQTARELADTFLDLSQLREVAEITSLAEKVVATWAHSGDRTTP